MGRHGEEACHGAQGFALGGMLQQPGAHGERHPLTDFESDRTGADGSHADGFGRDRVGGRKRGNRGFGRLGDGGLDRLGHLPVGFAIEEFGGLGRPALKGDRGHDGRHPLIARRSGQGLLGPAVEWCMAQHAGEQTTPQRRQFAGFGCLIGARLLAHDPACSLVRLVRG
jgi:hypothetical protein